MSRLMGFACICRVMERVLTIQVPYARVNVDVRHSGVCALIETMYPLIKRRAQRALEENLFPGCAIGVYARGQSFYDSFGRITYEEDAPKTSLLTRYDIASITKLLTALALLKRIDSQEVALCDPITFYVRGCNDSPSRESVAVHDLLTYTAYPKTKPLSDFAKQYKASGGRDACERSFSSYLHRVIAHAEFRKDQGRPYARNGTAYVMKLLLEHITNTPFSNLLSREVLEPLAMHATKYPPLGVGYAGIAPSEYCVWRRKTVWSEPHDESTYACYVCTGEETGYAGYFSTVIDTMKLLVLLIQRGTFENYTLLSEETVCEMTRDQLPASIPPVGLGIFLDTPRYMGMKCGRNTFGITGFTGCSLVGDIEREAGIVILSNHTFPKRSENKDDINKFRRDIADIVWENI